MAQGTFRAKLFALSIREIGLGRGSLTIKTVGPSVNRVRTWMKGCSQ